MTASGSRWYSVDQGLRSFLVWSTLAVLLTAFIFLSWYIHRPAYVWLGTEDALGENLTALFYFISGLLIFWMGVRKVKHGSSLMHQILPLLLGLFFMWVAAEEISWGQRIFGFETPASMQETNAQNEFNLHNWDVVSGPTALINTHRLFSLFMLFNGILIPVAYRFWRPARRFLNRINFPVMPIACTAFFVLGLLHGQTLGKVDNHWAHTEVRELIFATGFLLGGIAIFRGTNHLD